LPTPAANEREAYPKEYKRGNPNLAAVVLLPTPIKSDATKGGNVSPRPGAMVLSETIGGRLNPQFVEWMMGFPLEWLNLKPSETP
jgi:hypothetical protein